MENPSNKPPFLNRHTKPPSVYHSPRTEDYAEIFGGTRGGSRFATSIPVLDLPPAADFAGPFRGRHSDYSEVFGGSDARDFASFEELIQRSETKGAASAAAYDSSDEAWTPGQSEALSDELEPFSCTDMYQSMSNAEFHLSSDGIKQQFKVSYNKVFHKNEDDVANGVAHVTQLNDVPGYSFVVNETLPLQKMVVTNNLQHEDFGGFLGEGKRLRKTTSCDNKPFVTISDISLKTRPSHLPPPIRRPPILGPKDRDSNTQSSKIKASRSFAFGETTSADNSPLFYDVEVDASTSAAVSAAVMKDAMEKAEAKLKSAKHRKERNKQASERDLNGVKGSGANATIHGKTSSSKNEGNVEWKQDEEFYEVVEIDGERNLFGVGDDQRVVVHNLRNNGDRQEMGANLAISQQEEVNRKMKSDDEIREKILVEAIEDEDSENMAEVRNKETEVERRCKNVEREVCDTSLKEAMERAKSENRLKESLERVEKDRNEREAWEREEKEKREKNDHEREFKEKMVREAIEKEENEKRLRLSLEEKEKKQREAWEREEKEKREKEARERELEEKRLREAIEKEDNEKRLRLALEEKERNQREAREREEKEEREKEARQREEKEKRDKEAREREVEEKRLQKALEEEEKQREACDKEEKEKRENEARERELAHKLLKETIAQEDNEKRKKLALEKEENEKMQKNPHEGDEAEKRLKDDHSWQNIEEQPNSILRKEENKEKVKKGCELEKDSQKVRKVHEREVYEKRSKEAFDHEEIDKMWEEDYKLDENVAFCGAAHKVDENSGESKNTKGTFSVEDTSTEVEVGDLNSSSVARDNLQHKKSEKIVGDAKDSLQMHDTVFEFDKKPSKRNGNTANSKKVQVGKDKKGEKLMSTEEVIREVQKKNAERKGKSLDDVLDREEKEREERMKRERKLETERLRKVEEEREREREREKDRMAVDMASLERATADARQRAVAEARERLEKVNAEAKLRAERAAVERATAEARERAFQKAKVGKATVETRERTLRSDSCQGVGSTNGTINAYPSVHGGVEVESAERCKARQERHQRTAQRAAKALEEKNMRDLLAQRELAERNRLAEGLDAEVKRWSSGKEGNLRALLSTLQYILGSDSGWQPLHLTEIITSVAVKRAYRRATLWVHPDKLQQRGASIHEKYVCEKVFDLLKAAWNKFNSEER